MTKWSQISFLKKKYLLPWMIWEQKTSYLSSERPRMFKKSIFQHPLHHYTASSKGEENVSSRSENCQKNQCFDKAMNFKNYNYLICNGFMRVCTHVLVRFFKNRSSTWNHVLHCTGYILFTFPHAFSSFIHAPRESPASDRQPCHLICA